MLLKELLPYGKLKVMFKSTSIVVNHFNSKDVLKKLCTGIVYSLSVIGAALFIMAKQNAIFTSEQLNIGNFALDKQT